MLAIVLMLGQVGVVAQVRAEIRLVERRMLRIIGKAEWDMGLAEATELREKL
jgi:hypothetical protein